MGAIRHVLCTLWRGRNGGNFDDVRWCARERVTSVPQGGTGRGAALSTRSRILCALVLGGLVWLHRVATSSSQTATCGSSVHPAPLPGTPITLHGVDWSVQPSTLVVAISSACPHCVNNSSFYSDITRSAHRIPIVIVMPQSKQTAQSFLDEHSITPSRTISADLRNIQVDVTPTLMLVSPSGIVKQ